METKDEELVNLIARCALRDQQALKALYDRLGPYLNAVAFRILKSTEWSNDVLQEAFVQIWTNASSYRPDKAKPLTWITSILRYRALDRLAMERKHLDRKVAGADADDLDKYPGKHSPEEDTHSSQLATHIEACLARLNARVRESIKLAYLYGYSRDEIAEHYATSPNTVKSWLRRGADKLKQCLEARL